MTPSQRAHDLERDVVALLATLPDLPSAGLDALAIAADDLITAVGTDHAATPLLLAIAQVILAYRDRVAPLPGWAVLASSIHAAVRAIDEAGVEHRAALAAARFEVETLLPSTASPAPSLVRPDVSAASLVRRP
jgi:hypothetical protein